MPAMLDGDPDRVRLMHSLLLTLPGAPVLWCGEEIGMGDELSLEGRMAVRTPMQWSGDASGGFSTADPGDLVRPMVTADGFTPAEVNVLDQRRDRGSLLNWMERALRIRKESPELGWGTSTVLDVDDPAVLVTRIDWEDRTMAVVHNLARDDREVVVPDPDQYGSLTDVFADRDYDAVDGGGKVTIGGSGYRWLAAVRSEDTPSLR
jgi:maltose alpha-D-glucosyltransferase/alpha-amylase